MTFRIERTDLPEPVTVGLGFTSREQAERCARDWHDHWAAHGVYLELKVREDSPETQEFAVQAIRKLYGRIGGSYGI